MLATFNFEVVKERYRKYFQEATKKGLRKLPYYEIQPWDKVLDPVQLRIFQDIKVMGLPFYPIFPITEDGYLHFANPFNKVGIEIVYKHSNLQMLRRKIDLLKAQNWTIYETRGKESYFPFNKFFEIRYDKETRKGFNELNAKEQINFIETHKEENTACLLLYIQETHFLNYEFGNSDTSISGLGELILERFGNISK